MTVTENVGTVVKVVFVWQIKSTKGSSSKPDLETDVSYMQGVRDTHTVHENIMGSRIK